MIGKWSDERPGIVYQGVRKKRRRTKDSSGGSRLNALKVVLSCEGGGIV